MKTSTLCYSDLHTRWVTRRDIPAVIQIEAATSVAPWGEVEFHGALRELFIIGCIIEPRCGSGPILGFMIYGLHNHHLTLPKIAVAPDLHRRGIGTQMVDELKSKLRSHRRSAIQITVRESNLDGQLFFRRQGFKSVQVVRGCFDDTGEDGYTMRYQLAKEPS